MADPVSLASLAEMVRRRASGAALDRVEAAHRLSDELGSVADELMGFFIDEARRDGESWTAIGQRLGVSKQAARQRFGEPFGLGTSYGGQVRPRLRTCLEAAQGEARQDGSTEIGTHHQLIGLFREGVAAATLEKLGLREDAVRAAAHDLFPPSVPGDEPPPESPEASAAVEQASRMAKGASCDSVGTEHLLYVIAFDPGSRARRVLTGLGADLAALKKELACYVEPAKKRRRRRRKWDASSCSFCGKCCDDSVRLVAGPGVWICDACVRLCTEILLNEQNGG